MKKQVLIPIALVSAVSVAAPVQAQTVSRTYSVTGTVTAICTAAAAASIDFGVGGLADSNGNVTTGTKTSAADTSALCNGVNTKVTISHLAMQTAATTAVAGFTNTINFIPRLTVNTNGTSTNYDGDQANITIGPFSGLSVTAMSLSTAAGAKPLAGSYNVANTGSITIAFTPGA